MIKPVKPDIEALKKVVKSGTRITIFSPFYTSGGLLLLETALKENQSVQEIDFNCRLSKRDWIQGSIDPEALSAICKNLSGKLRFKITSDDMLHAKAYYNERIGLIGSANLTSQGFGNGLEFLLMISGNVLDDVKSWFKKNISVSLSAVSFKELQRFIKQNKNEVNKEKKKLNRILKRKHRPLSYFPVDSFIDYCAKLSDSAAKEVVLRFMGKDQLSGHIRNFYYASYQFLDKNKGLVRPLARISADTFRLQNTPYCHNWIKFVQSSSLKDIPVVGFRAKSTLNYLPVQLGGAQTTGGAGIGNLNRVLPLVARFIIDNK